MAMLDVSELIYDMRTFNLVIVNNYGECFEMNINLIDEKKMKYSYSILKVHPKLMISDPKPEDYINKSVEMNLSSRQVNDFIHDLYTLDVLKWDENPVEDSRPSNFYCILVMEVPNLPLIEKKFNFTYSPMWDYFIRILEDLANELIPIQMVEYIS